MPLRCMVGIAMISLGLAPRALAQGAISGLSAIPSSITFNSPDPDVTPANGAAAATVKWTMTGNPLGIWTVTVRAGAATLTNCPAVPVSAIQLKCSSVAPGANGFGICLGGTVTLSTTAQTIAIGLEGSGGVTTVTAAFTFTDSWQYPASSLCSVPITYTVNAP